MHLHTSRVIGERTRRVSCWAGYLAFLVSVAGCFQSREAEEPVAPPLDLSRSGEHTSGAWTYVYSISSPGTRSEGYHGELSYHQAKVPVPLHINDYYETPWGQFYWVGDPVVLFGAHGWMREPLAREPVGQALIDPAIVHSERFLVEIKVVTPEELATPDRLEHDPNVLAALKPFGLSEVHVQSNWFPIRSDPIRLHDTKRWGTLTICRADANRTWAPRLEFACTGNLTVGAAPKPVSLSEIMAVDEFPARPSPVVLSPQVEVLQPIQCKLSPVVGDPLVLYVVCRIRDQGPTPPWKSPVILQREAQ
ncbi:MAG: hypothetical protein JW993_14415 [Sedimentisphaerales bacterium]|nr:hypothetical protein [Sedimentisphaerales bacterium]